IAVDVEGLITTFNRAAEAILGYPATDVAGKSFADIFGRAFHPATGDAVSELRTNTGAGVRVHEQDAPLTDRTEQRLGSVKVFQDLREIEALREQVRRKDRLAALGEMAATVAHEIRNPLGGIRGFATLLQQDTPVEDPRHRLIQKIVTGTKNLDRVVNELLEYTRPVELDRRAYACAELVSGALALIDTADQPGVTYETHAQPDACVTADAAKMKQVLLNLLINARQSLNGPGAIRIWTETDAPYTVICVGDTGCGIPADQLDRIFSPFFTTKEKGTGLGLAVASKIVEIHGGTISATSVVGEGSVFRVRLPSVVARAARP
ncbi:MAG: ATP-binding protein, partial [Candidatus Hydrogenedentales bacterium]